MSTLHLLRVFAMLLALAFFAGGPARAQPTDLLKALGTSSPSPEPLPAEKAFALSARWDGATRRLIARVEPQADSKLYASSLSLGGPGLSASTLDGDQGIEVFDEALGERKRVIFGPALLGAKLANPGALPTLISAQARFQGCTKTLCYPPLMGLIQARPSEPAWASGAWVRVESISIAAPLGAPPAGDAGESVSSRTVDTADSAEGWALGRLRQQGEERGIGQTLALYLLLGALAGLSPCAYPMAPIALARLSSGAGSKALRLGRAALWCLGAGLAFMAVGWVSVGARMSLGAWLQMPLAVAALCALLCAVAAGSARGAQAPSGWLGALSRALDRMGERSPNLAAIGSGAFALLFATPCVAPALALALGALASDQAPWSASAGLLLMGVGLGLPIALLALGVGFLPRPGAWLAWAARVSTLGLLALAGWWAWPLAQRSPSVALPLLALALALALWGAWGARGGRAFGVAMLVSLASWAALGSLAQWGYRTQSAGAAMLTSEAQITARARASEKPLLLEFKADWCALCPAFGSELMSPELGALRERFELVPVDLSAMDASAREILRARSIYGPPAAIFLLPGGKEVPGTRIGGEASRERFGERMRLALSAFEAAPAPSSESP